MAASILVEFIGGPFDGHRQMLSLPADSLAETVALPVSRNIFQMLAGHSHAVEAPVTSVAIYELEVLDDRRRYFFLGATSATQPFTESGNPGTPGEFQSGPGF